MRVDASKTKAPAFRRKISKASSSASIPSAPPSMASARIPASAFPLRGRSSRAPAGASGRRIARDGRSGARFIVELPLAQGA